MNAIRFAAFLLVASASAVAADVQYLYKWTDKDGGTQYSDQMPKNPAGEVTRIEVEAPAPLAPAAAQKAPATPAGTSDIVTRRRAIRYALEKELTQARAKLDKAKAALEAATPEDSEKQVIQQRVDKQNAIAGAGSKSTGGMLGQGGMLGNAARSNCRDEGASTVCPTIVPGEAYYDRVRQLEDDVRKAEEEVAAAEQAWRRGVD